MKIRRSRLKQIIKEEEARLGRPWFGVEPEERTLASYPSWYEWLPSSLKPEDWEDEEWEAARGIDRELRPQGRYDPGEAGDHLSVRDRLSWARAGKLRTNAAEEKEEAAYERPKELDWRTGGTKLLKFVLGVIADPIVWAMYGDARVKKLWKRLFPEEALPKLGTAGLKKKIEERVLGYADTNAGQAAAKAAAKKIAGEAGKKVMGTSIMAASPLILAWMAADAAALTFDYILPKFVLKLPEQYRGRIEKHLALYHRKEYLLRKENPRTFDPKYPGTDADDLQKMITYFEKLLNHKYLWIKDKQGVTWLGGGYLSDEAAYWMKLNYTDILKRVQYTKKELVLKTRERP